MARSSSSCASSTRRKISARARPGGTRSCYAACGSGRAEPRLSRDVGGAGTFGARSLAERIMSERSYQATVLASALVWFLLGLHAPMLHQITHHNRMPDTTVLIVMAVLAVAGVVSV